MGLADIAWGNLRRTAGRTAFLLLVVAAGVPTVTAEASTEAYLDGRTFQVAGVRSIPWAQMRTGRSGWTWGPCRSSAEKRAG